MKAEEQQKRAMETLGKTNQRKPQPDEDEDSPPRKYRKTGSETMAYIDETRDRGKEGGNHDLERFS